MEAIGSFPESVGADGGASASPQFSSNQLPPAIAPGAETFATERCRELLVIYRQYQSAYNDDQKRLLNGYKDFTNYIDRQTYPWNSNVQIPMVYNAVRVLFARMVDAVMGTPKLINVAPWNQLGYVLNSDYGEMEFRARLCEAAANACLDLSGSRSDIMSGVLDGLIFGRVISKTGWQTVERADGQGGRTLIGEYNKTLRVTPFNFYPDPYCRNVQEARITFEVLETTRETAQLMAAKGVWVPDAPTLITWLQGTGSRNDNLNQTRRLRKGAEGGSDTGYGEVVEAWSFEDPDKNGVPTLWVFWFDAQTGACLGARENFLWHGQRPYIVGSVMPVPDQLYGMGVPEPMHALMHAASTSLNQLSDNLAAQNLRHLVLTGSGLDELALAKSLPNGIIRTDDMNAWKPIQAQPVPPDFWRILDYFDSKGQETSGVTPIAMAMRAASTAYGTSALQNQSQANFDIFAACLVQSWLTPMFRQHVKNIQQFLDLNVFAPIDVNGQRLVAPINRDDIQGEFYVECNDIRTADRRRSQAQGLGTLLSQALQGGLPMDYQWLLQQIFQGFDLGDTQRAFQGGNIWTPPSKLGAPTGVQGQNTPMPGTPPPDPTQMQGPPRLAIRPGVMGEQPQDLSGLLGGGA